MSTEIRAIQKDTVHRICSGQVVLNLATAIKELVENSLDAGATTVDVRLKEYGSELIEVVDNGSGIHPSNFQALTLKHHTSKLDDFCDLVNVETFGFRGEALSSLCAVSDVTVVTRHESEQHGAKLTFDSLGVLRNREPCARQRGTTITLTRLFSSLPVRQKEFHRNLKREFNKAVQILSAYCLIATNVKITCVNQTKKGGKLTFLSTQENKTIRDNISCVFGSKQLSTLLEIVSKAPDEETLQEFGVKGARSCESFTLHGYISSCEHGVGRSSTDRQFYFVNGRPCEPSKIIKLVNEIYHQYNQHQFPFVLMNIVVSKQMVDVNVTPDKRLIFLQNENLLLASVKSSLADLFSTIPSTFKVNNPLSGSSSIPLATSDRPKFTLSNLNKWRHTNDKSTRTDALKRHNDESECKIVYKQMKLNFIETSSAIPKIESSSANRLSDVTNDNNVSEAKTYTDESDLCMLSNSSAAQENDNAVEIKAAKNSSKSVETVKDAVPTTVARRSSFSESFALGEKDESKLNIESKVAKVETSDNDHSSISLPNSNEIGPHLDSHRAVEEEYSAVDVSSPPPPPSVNQKCVQVEEREEFASQQRDVRKGVFLNVSVRDIRRISKENRVNRERKDVIMNKFHAQIDPSKNQLAEEELSRAISKDMFLKMKIVGQFNMGFIIAKLENDLFIIDQHATDEKYNFETLQRTTSLNCQKLVIPQDLELTATNECVLLDNMEVFKKNGFEFCVDSSAPVTKRVKLVSIPTSRNWQFGKEDIDEMLFMLQDAPNSTCRPSRIRAMFASRACRKSVMIGTPLSVADMKRLITHMSEIEHPWNCPHGRPTMRHLINLSLLG